MSSWTDGPVVVAALGIALLVPAQVAAQVRDVCPDAEPECARAVLSAADGRAGFALVAAGGAPVPGSASTLGRRTATSRRFTTALRTTFAGVDAFLPRTAAAEASGGGTAVALAVDGAVAVFDGFFAAPTVGGVLSVDAVGSAGWVGGGGPMSVEGAFSWGAGIRIGLMRESFTLPGLSVSAMYRELGSARPGGAPVFEPGAGALDSLFWTADADAFVVRFTLGKRVGALDAVAGAGWDRVGGALTAGFNATDGVVTGSSVRDQKTARWSAFAAAGYTFLVFQVAAEAGWQQGGESHEEETFRIDGGDGRVFGGLSFRFTY